MKKRALGRASYISAARAPFPAPLIIGFARAFAPENRQHANDKESGK
jgi:hypothetical protein